ncbi:MAG: hypothetical protein RML45_13295 [Acetobacteraceae bacterium]|nr:hypothetical protein [Acetobacteraceae bacterium]
MVALSPARQIADQPSHLQALVGEFDERRNRSGAPEHHQRRLRCATVEQAGVALAIVGKVEEFEAEPGERTAAEDAPRGRGPRPAAAVRGLEIEAGLERGVGARVDGAAEGHAREVLQGGDRRLDDDLGRIGVEQEGVADRKERNERAGPTRTFAKRLQGAGTEVRDAIRILDHPSLIGDDREALVTQPVQHVDGVAAVATGIDLEAEPVAEARSDRAEIADLDLEETALQNDAGFGERRRKSEGDGQRSGAMNTARQHADTP